MADGRNTWLTANFLGFIAAAAIVVAAAVFLLASGQGSAGVYIALGVIVVCAVVVVPLWVRFRREQR